ncbi:MAG: hypothetical protein KGI50_07650 [Patescibacteria group bacterium]|nr:hypothetical protein [Patescibacteria group bacterium]
MRLSIWRLVALFIGFWGSYLNVLLSPAHFVWVNLKGENKRPINRFYSMRRQSVYSSVGAHLV